MATGTIEPGLTPVSEGGTGQKTVSGILNNIVGIYKTSGLAPSITVPNGRYILFQCRTASSSVYDNWRLSYISGKSDGTTQEINIAKSSTVTGVTLVSDNSGLTVSLSTQYYFDILLLKLS